ncbi:molybdopterin dinucleotide binding domain-containing protein [Streptomyces sp. 2RAF24]|uniref:molybdopterin dinucleotide binding domain-containing protein n=1 Tax=unclassified Streptomyces TaxID=2593676 RepID=UPI0034098F6C
MPQGAGAATACAGAPAALPSGPAGPGRRGRRSRRGRRDLLRPGHRRGELPPPEVPAEDAGYPLLLVTGCRWAPCNSGSLTRRGGNLLLDTNGCLDLHPQDAMRHGARDGTPVIVESRHGQARLIARARRTGGTRPY